MQRAFAQSWESLLRLPFSDRVKKQLTGRRDVKPGISQSVCITTAQRQKDKLTCGLCLSDVYVLPMTSNTRRPFCSAGRFHGNVRAVRACVWSWRGIKKTFSLPWSPKHETRTKTAPHYLIYDAFPEYIQCKFCFKTTFLFRCYLFSIFSINVSIRESKTLWAA